MWVKEIMRKDLVTTLPSDYIRDVAKKLAEYNVGSALVTDEGGKLKGIITDRDICLAVAAEGKDPRTTSVYETMTETPVFTEFDTDCEAALELMSREHIRRLPITENGKLAGIVSAADLAVPFRKQFNEFMGLEETYIRH